MIFNEKSKISNKPVDKLKSQSKWLSDMHLSLLTKLSDLYNSCSKYFKGQKCVIRGNLDGEDCSTERYQPLPFRTDGLSDCVFKKTNCTDEGLIMYTHGSTTKDTQCRCDHSKGFAFLSKPKHSCYCIPSQEDCSCYQKECQRGFKLSLSKYKT